MKHGASVRLMVMVITTSLVVGCSKPASSPAPETTALATLAANSPSVPPSTAPSASPEPTPAPAASTTPAPAEPLVVDWTRRSVAGLDGLMDIRGSASDGTTNVLVGNVGRTDDGAEISVIWASADGRHWDRVLAPPIGQRVLAVVAGGPGFVAVGTDDTDAFVWTSEDGSHWRARSDDALERGAMRTIVATRSGLVAFGDRTDTDSKVIWTSPDGIDWLAATNASGLQVARGFQAVAAFDGRAIAFVGVEGDAGGPVEVWGTTGRAEWQHLAQLSDKVDAYVWRAAAGPRGWVALGSPGGGQTGSAWYSADGETWELAPTGPDVSAAIIGVDAGFVATGAVGSLRDETCGDQRDYHGHTWTSADGRSWQRMPPTADFEWASIAAMLDVGPNLVGIGVSYPGEHFSTSAEPARWTARMPRAPAETTSDTPPPRRSCGG
jgi:hypothetical protein